MSSSSSPSSVASVSRVSLLNLETKGEDFLLVDGNVTHDANQKNSWSMKKVI